MHIYTYLDISTRLYLGDPVEHEQSRADDAHSASRHSDLDWQLHPVSTGSVIMITVIRQPDPLHTANVGVLLDGELPGVLQITQGSL